MMEALSVASAYTGAGVWGIVAVMVIVLIRTWPALTKLRNDSDASLRADLLQRLSAVETQLAEARKEAADERVRLERQLLDERKECREEIEQLRAQVEGLQRQIIQNSHSSAQMLGMPNAAPTTTAAIKDPKK